MTEKMDCDVRKPDNYAGGDCVSVQPPEPVKIEQMRVLAVDDSIIDRKLVEMLLKTSNFAVTAVSSVRKALEVLGLDNKRTSPESEDKPGVSYDLIITDYCMPEMTGYDLLKRVKDESSPLKEVPVVIMSSENRPRRIASCMAEGAQEFLIKPVQLADVQRLKCHVRESIEARIANANGKANSGKRKGGAGPSGLQPKNIERRARMSELTVA